MLGKHLNYCEDSLTAAVFSHLLHLPAEVFWEIVRSACYTSELPPCVGEPFLIQGWPQWTPKGTRNAERVIPDLFLRFPGLDLIIEAKRWDGGMQSQDQWRDQVTAYRNEYGKERVEVRLIALGGLWGEEDEKVIVGAGEVDHCDIVCPVHMCRWSRLLEECQRLQKELVALWFPSSQSRAHARILRDVIDLFACHGFQTGCWFADSAAAMPRLAASIESHCENFRKVHLNLILDETNKGRD